MKTPQEAAREYAETLWNRESTPEWEVGRDACKTRSELDFIGQSSWGNYEKESHTCRPVRVTIEEIKNEK